MSALSGRIDGVERKWAARCRLLWCAIAKCHCVKQAVGVNEPKHDDDRQVDGEEDHRLGPVRRLVLTFFSAENARDWATYRSCLAEDVEWVCYGAPQRTVVQGRDSYVAAMQRAYTRWVATFSIDKLVVDEDQGLAYAELVIDGRRSVDVFEVENGLIRREREYFDDQYWRTRPEEGPRRL